MSLAQMEFDSVLASKSPVAQFTLICGATGFLVWGRGVGVGVRTRVGIGVRVRD